MIAKETVQLINKKQSLFRQMYLFETISRQSYITYDEYSISQEICARFLLCCALLWLYIDWFSHIHQAYFAGTGAIVYFTGTVAI